MPEPPAPDWDPLADDVLQNPLAAYDRMRERCPVAYSERLHWSLFRHADVARALRDPQTFSNAVSQHLSVPNGMDPPEHSPYRPIIESYFSAERMRAFEATCRQVAAERVEGAARQAEFDAMADLALPFAAHIQCAFLSWPDAVRLRLIRWSQDNHRAVRNQDRQAMSGIAREFEELIDQMIEDRLAAGAAARPDITTSLMRQRVWNRELSHEEIASILRNWTVGELGTISASVGILTHHLLHDRALQDQLRADPSLLPAAIDEILRIHGPLVANRRVATRPVEIGGRAIAAGQQITLLWVAANRDGRVFEEPDRFRLDRDPAQNLLYGRGIHACPGAPLARLELRLMMEELLQRTRRLEPVPGTSAPFAAYPASGFSAVPVRAV